MQPGAAPAPLGRGRRVTAFQWVLIAVLAISFGVGVWMVARIVPRVAREAGAPAYPTPFDRSMRLDAGRYSLFERTGSQSGGAGFTITQNQAPDLAVQAVRVTDPSGANLPTFLDDRNETINEGGSIFTGAVAFQTPSAGTYRIAVTDEGHQVIVARSLFDGLASTFLVLILCGLVFVVAVVVLVVSLVRQSRHRRSRLAATS